MIALATVVGAIVLPAYERTFPSLPVLDITARVTFSDTDLANFELDIFNADDDLIVFGKTMDCAYVFNDLPVFYAPLWVSASTRRHTILEPQKYGTITYEAVIPKVHDNGALLYARVIPPQISGVRK